MFLACSIFRTSLPFAWAVRRSNIAKRLCLNYSFIAIARKGEKAEIYLYETTHCRRKKKSSILPDRLNGYIKEYSFLNFSLDDQRLVSLSTELEPIVTIWNVETSHLNIMGHIKIASNFICTEAIFCPVNINLISVCGKDNFKLLRH